MEKVRFLVIGTNFISDNFGRAADKVDIAEISAVYSRKLDTGKTFAAKYGIKKVYNSLDEALLDSEIDAVYVASPTFMHKEHTEKSLRSGKHVLCEKSIALNSSELSEMIRVAREEDRVLLEAMRPAFDPALSVIKSAIAKIGRVRRASLEYCQYSSRYDKFKAGIVENAFNPDIGNSALSDIGVYPLWFAIELFGYPCSIKSQKIYLENGFLGMGVSSLNYVDKLVTVTYSKITESTTPSVIEGEAGSVIIDRVSPTSRIYLKLRGKEAELLDYKPSENNMIYEIDAFARMVRGEIDFLPYLKKTEMVMKAEDEIHLSE